MTENNIGKHLASEQSKEGHGNILRSDMNASNAEQSREGPDNGGMPGSASKRGMKRKLERMFTNIFFCHYTQLIKTKFL
jgi:hypothetical protein